MRALYILAAIVLVLFLIGQVRIGGQVAYSSDGLFAWARLGAIKLQVLPWKGKKKEKPEKDKAKKGRKGKQKSGTGQSKPPEPPAKESIAQKLGGLLDYAQALLPIVLEAAGQFKHKLQVDTLTLELTVGASDPGDVALRYGQASAVLGALWYPLTTAFHVKDGNAHVKVDFDAQEMALYAMMSLSLKIGQIAWLGLYFGIKSLRSFLAVRSRRKQEKKQREAV